MPNGAFHGEKMGDMKSFLYASAEKDLKNAGSGENGERAREQRERDRERERVKRTKEAKK